MAVLREEPGGRLFPLRAGETVIGRDPGCDIVVATPETSSRHAVIINAGGTYVLEDLHSTNGTFVNGQRVLQRARLAANDCVELSGLRAIFCPGQNAEVAATQESGPLGTPPAAGAAGGPAILSSRDLS